MSAFKPIGRVLIIDLCPPIDKTMVDNLTKSLLNVVCLFCNSKYNQHSLSALGITAITKFCQCLLPLQQFKGKLPRYYAAMSSLWSIFNDYEGFRSETDEVDNAECLHEAIRNAIAQKKNLEKEISGRMWLQLEIIIFTAKRLDSFASKVEYALSTVDISSVKKIQTVRIVNATTMATTDLNNSDDDVSEQSNWLGGMIDKLQINNDLMQFDILFKTWLRNNDIDKERVRLNLPSTPEGKLTVKCDAFQRILNPTTITHADQLLFGSESQCSVTGHDKTQVFELSAVKLIHETGICESTVFGIPIVLRPTCCWQIDWSELEINQQAFIGLCQTLRDKKLVLIVKIEREESDLLRGHFAIFPSPKGNTLLLKSIAVNELLLPNMDFDFDRGIISSQIKQNVERSLNLIPVERVYEVDKYQCGLFDHILNTLKKSYTKSN